MFFDLELIKKCKYSKNEKTRLINRINDFVSFSEKARREGLLALEDDIENYDNEFLKLGMQLICDGTDPESVEDILRTNIYFSRTEGVELLEKFIIYEGCLCVQSGDNPRLVLMKLSMFLGDDGFELNSEEKQFEMVANFLESVKNNKPFSENTKILDDIFSQLDDYAIQFLFREIDFRMLVIALKGSSGNTYEKVFKNLSERTQVLLADELSTQNYPLREKDLIEAQEYIKNIVIKLRERGDIV